MLNFLDISKNSGYNIFIENIAVQKSIDFPGFITDFADNYQMSWNPQNVYGRMDPIMTYQRTSRNVTLSFDVLSPDKDSSIENMKKIRRFFQMMYPKLSKVDTGGLGRVLKAPPLMRVRFANLMQSASTGSGILVAMKGAGFKPSKEAGWVTTEKGVLLAKEFNITLSMDVLHEHDLGFDEENNWLGGEDFPYAVKQVNFEQLSSTEQNKVEPESDDPVAASRANDLLGPGSE
jgi:hypothetical protein